MLEAVSPDSESLERSAAPACPVTDGTADRRAGGLLDQIGRTPLLRLERIGCAEAPVEL